MLIREHVIEGTVAPSRLESRNDCPAIAQRRLTPTLIVREPRLPPALPNQLTQVILSQPCQISVFGDSVHGPPLKNITQNDTSNTDGDLASTTQRGSIQKSNTDPGNHMETFGARLARLRKKAGMTQAELAASCGWGEQQNRISNYETGRNEPALADIRTMAATLDVNPNDLAFGSSEQAEEAALEYGRAISKFSSVPVVGYAQLGPEGYWREMDYPAGSGDGYVDVPSADPNAYALRVRGDRRIPQLHLIRIGIFRHAHLQRRKSDRHRRGE